MCPRSAHLRVISILISVAIGQPISDGVISRVGISTLATLGKLGGV